MLRNVWLIVAIVVIGVAIGSWAIYETVGPPKPPAVGPQLTFLGGLAPIRRVPRLEPFKACDIYCYKSTLEEARQTIEEDYGGLFSYRSSSFDGLAWSSANDGSNLEIVVFPRKESKQRDETFRSEASKDWVSVYVYYPGKQKEEARAFDPKLIGGRWTFDDKDEIVTKKELVFNSDGTFTWTTVEPRRNRTTIATGTYKILGGTLLMQQTEYVLKTATGESISKNFPEMRYAVHWRDNDTFRMGEGKELEPCWIRVRE